MGLIKLVILQFLLIVPVKTEDTIIVDLAVALNTCQIKTGAPSRTERVANITSYLESKKNRKMQRFILA